MNREQFRIVLWLLALVYALLFCLIVVPPTLANADVIGALRASLVNPYAAGFALDAILCWFVLAAWVLYEARAHGMRLGWVALLLGIVPGVSTGFAVYLILRMRHHDRGS